jgi:hypothetical protein
MRFSAALVGAELIDRDTNVPYRGFASPKGAEKSRRWRRRWTLAP